ncbi:SWIB/MDM2 domain protein [Metarhizium album ARSEF 1941]|uniref:SWIB/MDM2 domain protein n=1 Tax=Metarhizium album (strain ARSEF 1941) TaxID=1081103 RepID=A0A0B2WZ36_METAS|nr:SWIB/MDM2 domain protein [Metarhizium album ARSEF 1941]KHN99268.1 SWIB/MDM2 domain protein [Metarhizium album ARSEF 1941]
MQTQYRSYPQQVPQRSPHTANQRRGGIGPMMSSGPHPSVPLTQAQIAQQQQAQAHAHELARRRSRKPTDKNIPEGVEDSIIDPEAVQRYKALRDVERTLDATITRKRLDVAEACSRSSHKDFQLSKTLRIWISNTAEDQSWQATGLNVDTFDFTSNMEASFRVKIEGRLLDDDEYVIGQPRSDDVKMKRDASQNNREVSDQSQAIQNSSAGSGAATYRLSHFFKSLSVDFDCARFRSGAGQNVEWKKPEPSSKNQSGSNTTSASDFDELTFKRNGDENMNIMINLYRHESPERYQLSPELAEAVDMSEATQQEAVAALWEYIRFWNLQEDEEKRNFRCDEVLRKIVGRGDIGYIPMLNEYVTQHLRPLPPVSLPYTIRVDEDFHKDPRATVYDVQVLIDDPLRSTLQPVVNNSQYTSMLKDVTMLDDQLARLIQAIAVSKAKHSFFSFLSEDPATFVKSWLSSQRRDLEVILGDTSKGGGDALAADEWRRGGSNSVWATQNARESVNVLLSRQR